MLLIGIGCSPVLMASYIFARVYSPEYLPHLRPQSLVLDLLATCGSVPLVWVVQSYGWRETLWGLAVVSALIAIAAFIFVRNPRRSRVRRLVGLVTC